MNSSPYCGHPSSRSEDGKQNGRVHVLFSSLAFQFSEASPDILRAGMCANHVSQTAPVSRRRHRHAGGHGDAQTVLPAASFDLLREVSVAKFTFSELVKPQTFPKLFRATASAPPARLPDEAQAVDAIVKNAIKQATKSDG